jgi:hypothetical protein
MKRLLLLLFIIANSFVLNAQNIIKTYKNEFVRKENNIWVTKHTNFESLTITVHNGIVIVDDKARSVYRTFGESYKKYEKIGIYTYYDALDESSIPCTIALLNPYDVNVNKPFIAVMYKYSWYIYYFTQID